MSLKLTHKHIEEIEFEDLTPKQSLVIALESAKNLEWNICHISGSGFIAFTKMTMLSNKEEIKLKISGNTAYLTSESTSSQLNDFGKNKENIENFIAKFDGLCNAFTEEELTQLYEEIKTDLVNIDDDLLDNSKSSLKEKIVIFLSLFKPKQGYFITPIIININIVVFILMVISGVDILHPNLESLMEWGANFRPLTLENEWWRLITNCFLHIGVIHLLMNMYALIYIGLILEPYLGKIRFTEAYFLTGIAASVTSLWWHDLTVSAGASGAIFGMYGVFLALLTTNIIEKSARKSLFTSILLFVGYSLFYGLKGGIDNAAHLGGLISGIIIGYVYYPSLIKSHIPKLKFITTAILTLVIVTSTLIIYFQIPNDFGKYDTKIKAFAANESKAIELFSLPENTDDNLILFNIKQGINYWNKNKVIINELEKLNLPIELDVRNKKLLQYCDLRIESYNIIYKAVEEKNTVYQEQIYDYNKQINEIIEDLRINK